MESITITDKEDIVDLYVLELSNSGIYPDKDEERSPRGVAEGPWGTNASDEVDDTQGGRGGPERVFPELGQVFAGFAEAGW